IPFQMELPLPVRYKDLLLDCGYRIDLLVSGDLIVEIKSVETLLPIHQAQILTSMRRTKVPLGLLINFNLAKLRNGIKRFVLCSFVLFVSSVVVRPVPSKARLRVAQPIRFSRRAYALSLPGALFRSPRA